MTMYRPPNVKEIRERMSRDEIGILEAKRRLQSENLRQAIGDLKIPEDLRVVLFALAGAA